MRIPQEHYAAFFGAIIGVGLALTFKSVINIFVPDTITGMLFTPAIFACAFVGGLVPGMLTVAVALPFVFYFSSAAQPSTAVVNTIVFLVLGTGIAWFAASFRETRMRADQSRRDLERRERYLQSILDSIPDATVTVTTDGSIIAFNAAAERQFGYSESDVLGRSIDILVQNPAREAQGEVSLCRYLTGERHKAHADDMFTGRRRDGTFFPMMISVGQMISGQDTIITGFIRDLTEREEAAADLHQTHAELARLARINDLGEMASTLAHELNQPLSAVANYLQGARNIISRDAPGTLATLRQPIEAATAEALRAGEIIQHLREFTAHGQTDRKLAQLHTLIREASVLALMGARELGIRTVFDFRAEPSEVLVDGVQIQQVLVNLMRNAVAAMRGQPRRELMIRTLPPGGDGITIEVSDTGTGFDENIVPQLFEPLVTTKPGGMGIGLSIARRIVHAHGGTIWAGINPAGGATVSFTLPLGGRGEGQ